MSEVNSKAKADNITGGSIVRKSDKWIPWYFVAFFVVLALLDGVFVYIANQTHTGVVTDDAYSEGLKYNQTIASAEANEQLGWAAEISYNGADVFVYLSDQDDAEISGADVAVEFVRPIQSGRDFNLALQELAPGLYRAPADAEQGQWDVRVYAKWKQQRFQAVRRIVVQPN